MLERALTAAEGIGDDDAKAGALGSLAERLPEHLLERALTAAEGIGNDTPRPSALGSLAERLPERLLERALTAAEGIGSDHAKAGALGSLAARLPDGPAQLLIARIPDHIATMRRNNALRLLAQLATRPDFPEALSTAEAISDVCDRWK